MNTKLCYYMKLLNCIKIKLFPNDTNLINHALSALFYIN